jgi:hypothetical protein
MTESGSAHYLAHRYQPRNKKGTGMIPVPRGNAGSKDEGGQREGEKRREGREGVGLNRSIEESIAPKASSLTSALVSVEQPKMPTEKNFSRRFLWMLVPSRRNDLEPVCCRWRESRDHRDDECSGNCQSANRHPPVPVLLKNWTGEKASRLRPVARSHRRFETFLWSRIGLQIC